MKIFGALRPLSKNKRDAVSHNTTVEQILSQIRQEQREKRFRETVEQSIKYIDLEKENKSLKMRNGVLIKLLLATLSFIGCSLWFLLANGLWSKMLAPILAP